MGLPSYARKAFIWSLPLFIILFVFADKSPGQGLPPFPGMGPIDWGWARITPEVQVGYQKFGLNFNMPAPIGSTLDVQLRDANLWTGSLAAVVDCPLAWSVALRAQANAKKNVTVFESQEYVLQGEAPVTWTGTKLEWWAIDGQLLYRLRDNCSVLIGLRRDHLALNLSEPRDSNGEPLNFDDSGVFPPFSTFTRHQRYYSDLLTKLWIPYVGIQIVGPGYKASLIGSPFASAEMKIPVSLLFDLTIFTFGFSTQLVSAENLQYHVLKPATFLEASFNYDIDVLPALAVGLWGNASWMSCRGLGNWDYHARQQVFNNGIPFPPNFFAQSQDNTTTYTRFLVGGGLSAVLFF